MRAEAVTVAQTWRIARYHAIELFKDSLELRVGETAKRDLDQRDAQTPNVWSHVIPSRKKGDIFHEQDSGQQTSFLYPSYKRFINALKKHSKLRRH